MNGVRMITASDRKHYQTQSYSLDTIIAVGYRVFG